MQKLGYNEKEKTFAVTQADGPIKQRNISYPARSQLDLTQHIRWKSLIAYDKITSESNWSKSYKKTIYKQYVPIKFYINKAK